MDQNRLAIFKQQFAAFKETEGYAFRKEQSSIVPLLKQIIWETLKNETLKNEHLTGLTQALRWQASVVIFEKYIRQNVPSQTLADKLIFQYNSQEHCGYTAAGKQAVHGLSKKQLAIVRQFLLDAYKIRSITEAKTLVENYEPHQVPIIKNGIYSPWLHYINSTVFPIINNMHRAFLEWLEVPYNYPAAIDLFATLRAETGEEHLGMLDAYAYRFEDNPANPTPIPEKNQGPQNPAPATIYQGPLNTILYGPPGTGKTYNSIDKAVEIATGTKGSHKENKMFFDSLRREGQIDFVTFHQNYTYEDFVVGIKPDIEFEQLRFKQHRGIFYEVAKRARENYIAAQEKRQQAKSFDEVLTQFLKLLQEGKEMEFSTEPGKPFKVIGATKHSLSVRPSSKQGRTSSLSIETLRDLVEDTRQINSGQNIYYTPLVKHFKEKQQISQQKPSAVSVKNFVLIIDEINRANISRVFGELITLLEKDKRIGEPNELRVTLPTGEKEFGLPPNFYLIGTMNTADKSIAMIDIALRRRFEFIGYYPQYNIDGMSEEQSSLLRHLNSAIYAEKRTPDFLIGHAYFLDGTPTETIISNKVVPLLMEYFSGKTDIVKRLFHGSGWQVQYNTDTYTWNIITPTDDGHTV